MAGVVYILCAILSFACAYLLYRGYRENQFRLLFWSSLGFLGFALNNVLLHIDSITGQTLDLSVIRLIPALLGMITLLYGLISETV
jgi:hypothetical protein